jgi:hypothetical protein
MSPAIVRRRRVNETILGGVVVNTVNKVNKVEWNELGLGIEGDVMMTSMTS